MLTVNVTPEGRLGLETFVRPCVGRVSTTFRLKAVDGPVFEATIV